jgi:hypothetical protein
MTPNTRFTEFLADIEPSSTTKRNASSQHNQLRSTLLNDEEFGQLHKFTFLSGSYKRDTAIRPRVSNGKSQRPDVDIIVVTKHSLIDSPVGVIDSIHNTLAQHYTPTNRQDRSVSVSTSSVDMDVVPLIDPYDNGDYYIADRTQEKWIRTNPPGHTQWTTDVNTASGGRFKPIVKMFKWWRRENPTVSKRPKGFVLEAIASELMSYNETHYGELFVQMLESIVSRYSNDISVGVVPHLSDPVLPANNILDGLSFAAFEGFYRKIESHAELGREALSLDDQDKATVKWQELFGQRFPKPPSDQNKGLLSAAALTTPGLAFPNQKITPPNKPKGFA